MSRSTADFSPRSTTATPLCERLTQLTLAAMTAIDENQENTLRALGIDLREWHKYGVAEFFLRPEDLETAQRELSKSLAGEITIDSPLTSFLTALFKPAASAVIADFKVMLPDGVKIIFTSSQSLAVPRYESRGKATLLSIYLATKKYLIETIPDTGELPLKKQTLLKTLEIMWQTANAQVEKLYEQPLEISGCSALFDKIYSIVNLFQNQARAELLHVLKNASTLTLTADDFILAAEILSDYEQQLTLGIDPRECEFNANIFHLHQEASGSHRFYYYDRQIPLLKLTPEEIKKEEKYEKPAISPALAKRLTRPTSTAYSGAETLPNCAVAYEGRVDNTNPAKIELHMEFYGIRHGTPIDLRKSTKNKLDEAAYKHLGVRQACENLQQSQCITRALSIQADLLEYVRESRKKIPLRDIYLLSLQFSKYMTELVFEKLLSGDVGVNTGKEEIKEFLDHNAIVSRHSLKFRLRKEKALFTQNIYTHLISGQDDPSLSVSRLRFLDYSSPSPKNDELEEPQFRACRVTAFLDFHSTAPTSTIYLCLPLDNHHSQPGVHRAPSVDNLNFIRMALIEMFFTYQSVLAKTSPLKTADTTLMSQYQDLRERAVFSAKQYMQACVLTPLSLSLDILRKDYKSQEKIFLSAIQALFPKFDALVRESKLTDPAGATLATIFQIFNNGGDRQWTEKYNGAMAALIHLFAYHLSMTGKIAISASGGCKNGNDRWQKIALIISNLCKQGVRYHLETAMKSYYDPFHIGNEHSASGKCVYPETDPCHFKNAFSHEPTFIPPSELKMEFFKQLAFLNGDKEVEVRDDGKPLPLNSISDEAPALQINRLLATKRNEPTVGPWSGMKGSFAGDAIYFMEILGHRIDGQQDGLYVSSLSSQFPKDRRNISAYIHRLVPYIHHTLENKFATKKVKISPMSDETFPLLEDAGSAAIFVVVDTRTQCISVGNLGDCKAILFSGSSLEVNELNEFDRPKERAEELRLKTVRALVEERRGGGVFDVVGKRGHRVSVSAGFGDTLIPHMRRTARISFTDFRPKTDILIIMCDGPLESLSAEDIRKIIQRMPNASSAELAEAILKEALQKGSRDNLSIIVVYLNKLPKDQVFQFVVADAHGHAFEAAEIPQAICDSVRDFPKIRFYCQPFKQFAQLSAHNRRAVMLPKLETIPSLYAGDNLDEYDLYLTSEFKPEECDTIKGNAVILTNRNTAYFIFEDNIRKKDEKPQIVKNINRQELKPIDSRIIKPIKCSSSRPEKIKIVNEARLKGGQLSPAYRYWRFTLCPPSGSLCNLSYMLYYEEFMQNRIPEHKSSFSSLERISKKLLSEEEKITLTPRDKLALNWLRQHIHLKECSLEPTFIFEFLSKLKQYSQENMPKNNPCARFLSRLRRDSHEDNSIRLFLEFRDQAFDAEANYYRKQAQKNHRFTSLSLLSKSEKTPSPGKPFSNQITLHTIHKMITELSPEDLSGNFVHQIREINGWPIFRELPTESLDLDDSRSSDVQLAEL